MSFDARIRISNIDAGEINVVSYHWGATRAQESGPAVVHDFSFVKRTDAASPALFTMCCSGARAGEAVFVARRSEDEAGDFLRYAFTDVAVVSVREASQEEIAQREAEEEDDED